MHDPESGDEQTTSLRRSQGQIAVARGLWYVAPGRAELRTERLSPPRPGEARIATEYSAISRGTERLVAQGEVPQSEWACMSAPFQSGRFPFPVKYGYSATGTVIAGSAPWLGRRVFALHPHQDLFQVPEDSLCELPESVSTPRGVLAANMETALNAHWDGGTAPGDRILIVGAGVLGLLIGYVGARIAGTQVAITDIDDGKAEVAATLGLRFCRPGDLPAGNRVIYHASATAEGLNMALGAAAFEGTIVEVSWFGAKPVALHLGGAFHSKRLRIQSSQVGHVAPSQRATLSRRERISRAIALLADPALDALIKAEVHFADLPDQLAKIWYAASLPPIVRY